MKMRPWRWFTVVACGLASGLACAQVRDFPSRPVRLVVPTGPGTTLDSMARVLGPKMAEYLGQSVVVDNRPGASTNIGMEIVTRAPGDGHTLLITSNGLAVNPSLFPNLPFNVQKDLAPVSRLFSGVPYVLVVNPSVSEHSVRELIALAKAKPGALNYSSQGNGSSSHIMGELFKHLTGTDMLHVPYKTGGPALTGVVGGEVHLTFPGLGAALPHVNAGRLRALAITSTKRATVLSAVPTVAEAGVPGYEFTTWGGMLAPGTTPTAIIKLLNGYMVKAVGASGLAERFASENAEIVASSPEHFSAHIKKEVARWSKIIKELGIRAD